jgi:hypothetical protein
MGGHLVNLGPLVNGPSDGRCPAWTPDLRVFLFDSMRESGFGEVPGYPVTTAPAIAGP